MERGLGMVQTIPYPLSPIPYLPRIPNGYNSSIGANS